MASALLEALREPLDLIIAEASADLEARNAARAAELDQREAEIAKAMELATVDSRVRAAWRECALHERRRFQALISRELADARPMSAHRTSLLRLSRYVMEVGR